MSEKVYCTISIDDEEENAYWGSGYEYKILNTEYDPETGATIYNIETQNGSESTITDDLLSDEYGAFVFSKDVLRISDDSIDKLKVHIKGARPLSISEFEQIRRGPIPSALRARDYYWLETAVSDAVKGKEMPEEWKAYAVSYDGNEIEPIRQDDMCCIRPCLFLDEGWKKDFNAEHIEPGKVIEIGCTPYKYVGTNSDGQEMLLMSDTENDSWVSYKNGGTPAESYDDSDLKRAVERSMEWLIPGMSERADDILPGEDD